MKLSRAMIGAALAAAALAAHAQDRPGRDRGDARPRGEQGRPWRSEGGPRGGPYGAPRGGAYGGQRGGPYGGGAPYGYPPPQRFAPPGEPPPGYGAPSQGEWRSQQDFVRGGVRRGQLAPLGSVIENLRRMTPGRQLDAGLEYMGPRLVYRVRWMTDSGRRVDYFVDAATGAILSGR